MGDRRRLLPFLVVVLLGAGGVVALGLSLGARPGPGEAEPVGESSGAAPQSPDAADRPAGTAATGQADRAAGGTSPDAPAPSGAPGGSGGIARTPGASARTLAPLPVAIASIGDSLAVAFDADDRFGPAPEHSWVVGTDPADGVDSHLERLRRLDDASIAVVDAARSGARIADAPRQATAVLAGLVAQGIASGPVYLTFELGANDVCGAPPGAATSAGRYRAMLDAALRILRDGATAGGRELPSLPRGSLLLLLSVPDLLRLRTTMADVPAAQAMYARFGICAAALGPERTAAQLKAVATTLSSYDAAIRSACATIERTDGPSGRLHCRTDEGGSPDGSLATAPFGPADISALDYFHPSLSGQARIAEGAWRASYWADASPP